MEAASSLSLAIVTYDEEEANKLAVAIGRENVEIVTKRGLDGTIAEWIVVAAAASRAIHASAVLALRYVELTRVRSIHARNEETGLDVRIESPSRDDVEKLIELMTDQLDDA